MVAQPALHEDRRRRRRQETIEEVLDIALGIMGEQGVAGLSIGEIARRMGIRPPSLYVYFPSKQALYDALFARGARLILEEMEDALAEPPEGLSLEEALTVTGEVFIRWSLTHPAYTQLLFWRPVPGFQPTPEAYAPALRLLDICTSWFEGLQQRGLVRTDVAADVVTRDWTIVGSGIISQQLANAPGESFEEGSFTNAFPALMSMFARHYGAPTHKPAQQKGRHRGNQG